ncbi:MAG: protease complex subunit PrcB family protein [Firmicutes bacterium]|nr:protease complex subunit PrcB family protein [Bacillota bacterium]
MKKSTGNRVGKKAIIGALLLVLVVAAAVVGCSKLKGDSSIEFTSLASEDIPKQLAEEVMPEYQLLERALACMVDGKVYVAATRGEKTTSGYGVAIEKITWEEIDGLNKMTVYAVFTDPASGELLTQEITYPYAVAETSLEILPDEVELKVQYAE